MQSLGAGLGVRLSLLFLLALGGCSSPLEGPVASAEKQLLSLIGEDNPYSMVSTELFEQLGWDLPDEGRLVKELAESIPGGAFDPVSTAQQSSSKKPKSIQPKP